MATTTPQDQYLSNLDSNWSTFRAALVAALEADNDTAATLATARTARTDYAAAVANVLLNLGAVPGSDSRLKRTDFSAYCNRASVGYAGSASPHLLPRTEA